MSSTSGVPFQTKALASSPASTPSITTTAQAFGPQHPKQSFESTDTNDYYTDADSQFDHSRPRAGSVMNVARQPGSANGGVAVKEEEEVERLHQSASVEAPRRQPDSTTQIITPEWTREGAEDPEVGATLELQQAAVRVGWEFAPSASPVAAYPAPQSERLSTSTTTISMQDAPNDKPHGASHHQPQAVSGKSFDNYPPQDPKRGNSGDKEKGNADGEAVSEPISMEEMAQDPDMAWMPPEWRETLIRQVWTAPRKPATFWGLFRLTTKREAFLNILGVFCAILAGVAQPAMTILFGNLTTAFTNFATAIANSGATHNPQAILDARDELYSVVNKDALILVAIGVGMWVCTFVATATWIYTGESTTRRIREAYLRAVLRQNIAYFDKLGAGEVITRIRTDTHLIQDGISDKIPMSMQLVATFFAGFTVAYIRNWRLALVMSSMIPVIAIAGAVMNRYVSGYRRRMLEETALGGTMAEETISSVRNAHAFGTQDKLLALYDIFNERAWNLSKRSSVANATGMLVLFFVLYSAYALAFWEGSRLLVQGHATSGDVINVFFAILMASFSLAQLPPNMQAVAFAQGAASNMFATIDRVPLIDSADPGGLKPETCDGLVEFKDVEFVYPSRPSVHVLKKFSITMPRGKTTALVGQSGSGKSTCIGLLERFYEPVGGVVLLDGRDIRTLNIKWLRTQIGLVSQEPTLFATSVYANVAMGLIGTAYEHAEEATKRKLVVEACSKANADSFITNLQQGYDTMIGERGMLLSGGQKQRIAIARAIVSDPKILLLDEASAALDTNSERIVQDALEKASAGRTTITIAHRLSTIQNADQIVVMQNGEIVETGTHHSLLERPDGAYFRLVEAQKFRDEEDGSEPDDEAGPGGVKAMELENEVPMGRRISRRLTRVSTATPSVHEAESEAAATKYSMWYLFYRLGKLNRGNWWMYAMGGLASITLGMVYPVFGIVFGSVLDVFSSTDHEKILAGGRRYGLLLFVIAIVAFSAVFVQSLAMGMTAERLSFLLRHSVFKAILRQDIAFFDEDKNSTGALTANISDWPQKVQGLAGITLGVIFQSIVLVIGGSVIAVSFSWKIGLVGVALAPLAISAGILRLKVIVLKDAKTKKAHAESAQVACESAAAIRTVASLTREEEAWNVYHMALDEPQRKSNQIALSSNLLYSFGQGMSFWAIALIFWYGSRQLVEAGLSTKQFFTVLICTIFASIQAGNVFTYAPDMSKAKEAAADIVDLLDARPKIDAEAPSGKTLTDVKGQISFRNVHFRYPTRPTVKVLQGLNLDVSPGQFVALVGPSGCGKSTIVQLIERFYDPPTGQVTVDGHDVSELNIVEYRRHVSLVSQEPTLYAGSVRFNILLGASRPAEEITQKEVEQACRDANIHDFITSLPDGYETEVGGKGMMLSGGQKQRVAIARALIRNPKILLLDESTSALDSESEKIVQQALDQAAKGRTTIAVAHRLSTIQNADVIFVLKDGVVAEKGRHHELLARKGIYSELVTQQALERQT